MMRIEIAPDDPDADRKRRIAAVLQRGCHACEAEPGKTLVDLTGVASLGSMDALWTGDKVFLVRPGHFFASADRDRLWPAYPWRHWAAAQDLGAFVLAGDAGPLVSLRVMVNRRKSESRGPAAFYAELLPGMVDLCGHVTGLDPLEIQVRQVPGACMCFALLRLAGGVVAEIELNEALPDSMESVRFLRAHFKEGAFTNMPLGGDLNVEGSWLATDDGAQRLVHEHMAMEGGDEVQNLYFRMMYDLVCDGRRPRPGVDDRAVQRMIARSLQSRGPCRLEDAAG